MIIPLDALSPDVLHSIAESFVLREGTDYGEQEVSFDTKVEQVIARLKSGDAVLVYSELHETVDIRKPEDVTSDEGDQQAAQ